MINLVDFKTDRISDDLVNKTGKKVYWNPIHKRNLKLEETFNFTTLADIPSAEHARGRMTVMIKGEDDDFREFVIVDTKSRKREKDVMCVASYLDINESKVIEPIVLDGQSIDSALDFILPGTGWERGVTEYTGRKKLTISDPIKPYDLLLKIKTLFEVELDFRVEVSGNRVLRRVVDAKKRLGMETFKEVTFGKDLIDIERQEDSSRIVSALYAISPENELGTRLKVIVKDEEARLNWSRSGKHIWDIYEPQSDDQNMTVERLETLAKTELNKRKNPTIQYIGDAVSIEHIFSRSHEKIRLGDSIRVKDEKYKPPIYLDARVIEIERDIDDKAVKRYTLGDFIEYKQEDVLKVWNSIKNIKDNTYPRGVVDEKLTETGDKVKTDIETGQVPLPGESITGIVNAEHLDIDINILGGVPQYRSAGLISFSNQWTYHNEMDTGPDQWYNWSTFDFLFFRNTKRYLRVIVAGGLERAYYQSGTNTAVGFIDIRITDDKLNTLAEKSASAWISNKGATLEFNIDLGTVPLPPKYYYIQFKARKTGGDGDLLAGMRMAARYLYSVRT